LPWQLYFVVSVFVVSTAMAQTPRLDAEGYDMDKPAPPGTLGEGQVRSDPATTGEMSSWGPHHPVRFLMVQLCGRGHALPERS
jgi:hypothetical protein